MPAEMTLLFVAIALVLGGIMIAIWRYWGNLSNVSPDDEAFDKRVASLNERQANRFSDDLIRRQMSQEDAWSIMIEKGRRAQRHRNRYAGSLERRTSERRRRR